MDHGGGSDFSEKGIEVMYRALGYDGGERKCPMFLSFYLVDLYFSLLVLCCFCFLKKSILRYLSL